MTTFGLIAVEQDGRGRVVRAQVQEVDGAVARGKWLGAPRVLPASEVADLITQGHTVISVFLDKKPGHNVSGSKFRAVVVDGAHTIALEEDFEGEKISDLKRL